MSLESNQDITKIPVHHPKTREVINVTIAAGPVIIRDGKVLLVRNNENLKFPGGTVRMGETYEEAMRREFREEMGSEVEISGEPITTSFRNSSNFYLLVHYPCRITNENFTPDSEIKEWGWFDINNIPKNSFPNVAEVLKQIEL